MPLLNWNGVANRGAHLVAHSVRAFVATQVNLQLRLSRWHP